MCRRRVTPHTSISEGFSPSARLNVSVGKAAREFGGNRAGLLLKRLNLKKVNFFLKLQLGTFSSQWLKLNCFSFSFTLSFTLPLSSWPHLTLKPFCWMYFLYRPSLAGISMNFSVDCLYNNGFKANDFNCLNKIRRLEAWKTPIISSNNKIQYDV